MTVTTSSSLNNLPTVSNLTLIVDSLEANSHYLFQHYFNFWAKSEERIIFAILFNTPVKEITSHFEGKLQNKRVVIFDYHSNSHNWNTQNQNQNQIHNKNENLQIKTEVISNFFQLHKQIQNIISDFTHFKHATIVIDSISSLILRFEVNKIRNYLDQLNDVLASQYTSKQSSVISFIHSDNVSDEELKILEYGVGTVIDVNLPNCEMEISDDNHNNRKKKKEKKEQNSIVMLNSVRYLTIRHLRPTGRVAWANEGFGVDINGNIVPMQVIDYSKIELQPTQPEIDPTKNLTFNLKLSEEEKIAKDNVVLPYMFHLNKNTTGGSIIIEDDEDDDYDAEDPDDDLDL